MKDIQTVLQDSNRVSGDWLPDVELCPNRMVPCGNTMCADEAMRAAMMGNSPVEAQSSRQAIQHAQKVASNCEKQGHPCPMSNLYEESPTKAVDLFIDGQLVVFSKRL